MKFIQPSELGNTYKFSLVSWLEQLIKVWNNLNDSVIEFESYNVFKRAVSNLVMLFVITRGI